MFLHGAGDMLGEENRGTCEVGVSNQEATCFWLNFYKNRQIVKKAESAGVRTNSLKAFVELAHSKKLELQSFCSGLCSDVSFMRISLPSILNDIVWGFRFGVVTRNHCWNGRHDVVVRFNFLDESRHYCKGHPKDGLQLVSDLFLLPERSVRYDNPGFPVDPHLSIHHFLWHARWWHF